MPRRVVRHVVSALAIAGAVAWTFLPAASFAFLNWDDRSVILQNPALNAPGVVSWAFSTTYMEHYQPIAWLAWAGIVRAWGADPAAFHIANVAAHGLASLLVWAVARRLLILSAPDARGIEPEWAAVMAALLFSLHPLRVEVVAWISALPYALALVLLLASLLAYLRRVPDASWRWTLGALVLFGASLLARPVGVGLPIILFVLDTALLRRAARASAIRALAFAVPAIVLIGVETMARGAGASEVPWIYRAQLVATAPFVYLWHTVLPIGLTPLDALPLQPRANLTHIVLAVTGLAAITLAAWRWRHRFPAASVAWVAYLALVAPTAGAMPSGLQATADRYAYLPGVAIVLAAAGLGRHWAAARPRRATVMVLAAIAAIGGAVVSRATLAPWSDSISLWTRVVALDPRSDPALYNLGTALVEAGRPDEAAIRYREVLAIQPDHSDARANLARLDAARLEREGNDLATRGNLAGAADRYGEAVALDPARTHAHAARGMALATLGRADEALPALREAVRQGATDAAVSSALGVLLRQSGQAAEARAVLEAGLAAHHDDVGLAANLARLLATLPDALEEDRRLALQLARAVADATGGRDPRILDTLAAALAVNGRMAEARVVTARAAALATRQGDAELAVQITARGRAYRNPGQ